MEESDAYNKTSDDHNLTVGTFSQAPNTQRDNTNAILKSEKLDKLYALEETLKDLKINNAGYYVSYSANANGAKGDPASALKTVSNNSDRKKRKFTVTSNGIFNKNY